MKVIGRKPVLELLQSGRPILSVMISQTARGKVIGDILRESKTRGVRLDRIPPERVDRVLGTGNHQGVAAETSPVRLYSQKELLTNKIPIQSGLLMALDGVTDPHHLGAIARSALGAGCDALLVPERKSAVIGETAIKASAGALLRIPLVRVRKLHTVLEQLKEQNWWIRGAAGEEGAEIVWEMQWAEREVIVMGSEGEGLGATVRKVCDSFIQIPLAGELESLSVSSAAAVLLFSLVRDRRKKKIELR